ncbi:MAG: UbiD family decarboxylase [Chloroflexi bacterium]|nr:UbiD family decarboxylase [Chloroflexota bacterium]
MPYKGLRDWLEKVGEMGELLQINGVDWDLELGAISRINFEKGRPGPALLFDEIKDYPKGYRVLTGILGSVRRSALTTGIPPQPDELSYVQAWRDMSRKLQPIPPEVVKTGPVLENDYRGKEVDLWKFPTPKWDDLDAGRYIGTGHLIITRDPQEGWVNLGTYRTMIVDQNTLVAFIDSGKNARIHRERYFDQGKPCPIALVFGQDPLLFLAGATEIPHGFWEYDWAGGIKGNPIKVIQGEITGLPIPAEAEIAVEGECLPGEMVKEGPFSEWPRHYGTARLEPVIRVKRLMHRNDPVITSQHGAGFARGLRSALLWDELEKAGVPDIRGVYCHPVQSGGRFITVISIKQRYAGHAKHAALAAMSSYLGNYMGKYVIVVDEDIDPFNTNQVLWAVGTRSDPVRSIDIIRDCWDSLSVDPGIPPDQKGLNSRAIIDACKPYQWMNDFPPVVEVGPDMRKRVLEKWGKVIGVA